jgi:guanylate kinase
MGKVSVIAGPTAVGKGTLVRELAARYPQIWVSVSATTRRPRPGEIDGVHYHFISEAEFDELIATDGLLEWAQVHGAARYGTPKQPVLEAVAAGRHAILEIDLQGARQIREKLPSAFFVFIMPPSWETLEERIAERGSENSEEVARRLQTAAVELAASGEFDAVVVNADLGKAVAELVDLLGLDEG